MNRKSVSFVCTLLAAGWLAAFANGSSSKKVKPVSPLAPFEFQRSGAGSPEEAAKALFHGIALESPKDFVQHLLLGVCDGSIDTLQKFAECMHVTRFRGVEESFSFYELRDQRQSINRKSPIRVIQVTDFDTEEERVQALHNEMVSTYYGQTFKSVDLAAKSYKGREFQTRIVVASLDDRWYAIPRCRSARKFYAIADAMDAAK